MMNLFVIIDCSQSVYIDNTNLDEIGQINYLLNDMINPLDKEEVHVRVIGYNDKAWVYYNSQVDQYFLELSPDIFQGRSNLGQAYALIKDVVVKEELDLSKCCIVLISDGQATDNYRKNLVLLDGKRQAYRIALTIGSMSFTTHDHATNDELMYTNGFRDRDDFLQKLPIL